VGVVINTIAPLIALGFCGHDDGIAVNEYSAADSFGSVSGADGAPRGRAYSIGRLVPANHRATRPL